MDSIAFIIESTKFEVGDLQHFSLAMCALKYLSFPSTSHSQVDFHSQIPRPLKWVSTWNGLLPRRSISPVSLPLSLMQDNCTPAAFSPLGISSCSAMLFHALHLSILVPMHTSCFFTRASLAALHCCFTHCIWVHIL